MAGEVIAGADVLVIDPKDHVATALKDLEAGEGVSFRNQGRLESLVLLDPIPFGHKVAITDIAEGMHVLKYGEVIGRATALIEKGRHVHVHNVEGIRGRGDRHQA